MKIIGLTGGIGTGKSTVSDYLIKKGITVIDADKIAHQITQPGQKTLTEIARVFGSDLINPNGALDRKGLAKIAFSSEENTKKLENITHGAIKEEIARLIEEAKNKKEVVAVIDAPLLIESRLHNMCDAVWVVTASHEIRVERIKARDRMTEEEISARMERQLSDTLRNEKADEIIDNSGGKEELYSKVEHLLGKYV